MYYSDEELNFQIKFFIIQNCEQKITKKNKKIRENKTQFFQIIQMKKTKKMIFSSQFSLENFPKEKNKKCFFLFVFFLLR